MPVGSQTFDVRSLAEPRRLTPAFTYLPKWLRVQRDQTVVNVFHASVRELQRRGASFEEIVSVLGEAQSADAWPVASS